MSRLRLCESRFRTSRRAAFALAVALAALVCAAGCRRHGRQSPIGEAYVAPMLLNLRQELAPRAPVTATVKHGDRLQILERRRRMAKVRTEQGQEGWTDGQQLLSPKGMARLRRESERARHLPSQGKASPFDLLNVHITPNLASPSFTQLAPDADADVIGRAVTIRGPYVPEGTGQQAPPPDPNALRDDWSLVRLADGRSGWVLSRLLMMNLPDEVTQFADRHRITSYFSLGAVQDRDQTRQHWLWTTISTAPEKYQFDSIRVFVWNTRRHRYETVYHERGLRGYYPVTVDRTEDGTPRIRLLSEGKDGILTQRTFLFRENRLRQTERIPWRQPVVDPEDALPNELDGARSDPSWWSRIASWIGSLWN